MGEAPHNSAHTADAEFPAPHASQPTSVASAPAACGPPLGIGSVMAKEICPLARSDSRRSRTNSDCLKGYLTDRTMRGRPSAGKAEARGQYVLATL